MVIKINVMCHTWVTNDGNIRVTQKVTSGLSKMVMKSNLMRYTWVTGDGYEAYVIDAKDVVR